MTDAADRYPERELFGCRVKWTDPDFRPRPRTSRYCLMCGRDIKPDRPARIVEAFRDTFAAIHPDDHGKAEAAGIAARQPVEPWFLGPDCARRLGMEWSTAERLL